MHAWFFEDLIPDSIKDALNIQGIPAYGTMIFLAIVVAAVYLILMYKKFGFTQNEIIWMLIYLTVFGLLGAHVFSLLFRVGEIDFSSSEKFWKSVWHLFSSLMYYGGLIGGTIGLYVFSKKERVPFFLSGDLAASVLPIVHAIGRIGCFFAGCCYGKQTDAWYGVEFFYGSSVGKVVPTQLFESIFNFLLFCAMIAVYFAVYRKGFIKNEKGQIRENKYEGIFMTIYLLAYPVFRFTIEFFRDDQRGVILGLSTSQFISIFVFGGGIYMLIRLIKRIKGTGKTEKNLTENTQLHDNGN